MLTTAGGTVDVTGGIAIENVAANPIAELGSGGSKLLTEIAGGLTSRLLSAQSMSWVTPCRPGSSMQ
jgi:hypothetical protein